MDMKTNLVNLRDANGNWVVLDNATIANYVNTHMTLLGFEEPLACLQELKQEMDKRNFSTFKRDSYGVESFFEMFLKEEVDND